MSKGVLIFAVNSTIDYVRIAEFAAAQTKEHLGLPVTLVTDKPYSGSVFDNHLVIDREESTVRHYEGDSTLWFNASRTRAYEITPYDQTLLIDADYLMFNDSLSTIFDTTVEMACYDEIHDVTGRTQSLVRLDEISIPMQWATVLYFTKSKFSESVFAMMDHIKQNWDEYALIYHFKSHNFRNDYALSIALQTLTGWSTSNHCTLPGKLHTLTNNTTVKYNNTAEEILFSWDASAGKLSKTNVHVMNKLALEAFYA